MTLLITGGASGIGAETARRAAKRGHKVAINYRSREAEAHKVVADIAAKGGQAVALAADVSREADISGLFDSAEKALGPITHLVNSAGIGTSPTRVADFDAAVLARLFAVNAVGLMLCCREAARRMRALTIVSALQLPTLADFRPPFSHCRSYRRTAPRSRH